MARLSVLALFLAGALLAHASVLDLFGGGAPAGSDSILTRLRMAKRARRARRAGLNASGVPGPGVGDPAPDAGRRVVNSVYTVCPTLNNFVISSSSVFVPTLAAGLSLSCSYGQPGSNNRAQCFYDVNGNRIDSAQYGASTPSCPSPWTIVTTTRPAVFTRCPTTVVTGDAPTAETAIVRNNPNGPALTFCEYTTASGSLFGCAYSSTTGALLDSIRTTACPATSPVTPADEYVGQTEQGTS